MRSPMQSTFLASLCLVTATAFVYPFAQNPQQPTVMVLSFDGLRFDLISEARTPFLKTLRDASASPAFVRSVFPAMTLPNHFTVATGLYADQHGVIGNFQFDKYGEPISNQYEQYHGEPTVLPIWIENEMYDERYSGTMMWPGAEFEYQKKRPTHFQDYSKEMRLESRVDMMLSWIKDKQKPANLVMAYYGELDLTFKTYGLNSEESMKAFNDIDETVRYLLEHIQKEQFKNKINLIIMSGHGIATVDFKGVIVLNRVLTDDFPADYIFTGASGLINPWPGMFNRVLNRLIVEADKLETFEVYTQREMQENWHFGNAPQFDKQIYLLAKQKRAFLCDFYEKVLEKTESHDKFSVSVDGYDNMDIFMHGIFIGWGPMFKPRFKASSFDIIDMYPLLKHVLGLKTVINDLQNNVVMPKAVEEMLKSDPNKEFKNVIHV